MESDDVSGVGTSNSKDKPTRKAGERVYPVKKIHSHESIGEKEDGFEFWIEYESYPKKEDYRYLLEHELLGCAVYLHNYLLENKLPISKQVTDAARVQSYRFNSTKKNFPKARGKGLAAKRNNVEASSNDLQTKRERYFTSIDQLSFEDFQFTDEEFYSDAE